MTKHNLNPNPKPKPNQYPNPNPNALDQVLTMAGEPLQVLPMPTANRVPPYLHGLCLGDNERQLWATDTERNVLHRLAIRVYAE